MHIENSIAAKKFYILEKAIFRTKFDAKSERRKERSGSMPARCVVRLLQMRIAGACPSPPGHTRDIMALCGARNVHAHPV